MREQWLSAVRSRLDGDNGPYVLLEEKALTEAVELFVSTERVQDLWETRYFVGLLHLRRAVALGDRRSEAEITTARPLLSFAYAVRSVSRLPDALDRIVPKDVPPELIAILDQRETDWDRLALLMEAWLEIGADPHALRLAVAFARNAVKPENSNQAVRAQRMAFFSAAQRCLFEHGGDLAVLEDAIAAVRAEAARLPSDDPDRFQYDHSLAESLRMLFERTGELAALRESLDLGRRVLDARPDGSDQRYVHLLSYSTSARLLHQFTHDPELLDEAGKAGAAAVELVMSQGTAAGSLVAATLGNHALLLQAQFDRTGDQPILDEAIHAARRAVQAAQPRTPLWIACRYNLSVLLRNQFDRTGDLVALGEAIDMVREVLQVTPPGHPDAASYQAAYVGHLHARFGRTGEVGALDEAIELGATAVGATAEDHPNRPMYLNNLAIAMKAKAEHAADDVLIDKAIAIQRLAVQTTVDSGFRRAGMLSTLGNLLAGRYDLTGEDAALDQAIDVGRAALAAAGADHPDRSALEMNLVASLSFRDSSHRDEMLDLLEAAAMRDGARPAVRVEAARTWGQVAMTAGRPDRAVRGFEVAVELLPVLAARGLTRADATHWMAQHAQLVCDAAACELELGRTDRAAELLESGRGVLMAQALESRTDLSDLRDADPALADEFGYLCRQLDSENPHEDRQVLASRFAELLTRIRAVPGFDAFMLPRTVAQLAAEASGGPIVLVNVSQYRCDALVLTEAGVTVRPLPELELSAVRERLGALRAAVAAGPDPAAQQVMQDILAWLSDTVTNPVLRRLAPDVRRLWWVPCGLLAYFPLHATVLDRVMSSYTPTIRALAHARARQISRTGPRVPRLLAVGMSKTPGESDLPGAHKEMGLLGRLLPDVTPLVNEDATHDAILSRLATREWAHFACHAAGDPADPGESRLVVHDHASKPLCVAEISRLDLSEPEFAFLSACSTATTSLNLVDESIHIASAFQLAGYPHVIGTLWEISDSIATKIATRIYTELATCQFDIRNAAGSLHKAIRMVRDLYPQMPTLWAAHIHVGP
ncbi:CHAT domain-containing protein [Amycolatopsis sp. NPDC051758]|uniref:CHAT domain-containing protein n=1 Tax=Amycolatopsis sp. NPDC051758 TaxID=3363935 RepID=UPI0037B8A6C2